MKSIHINSYLSNTSLYYNLFEALEGVSVSQNVFVPLRIDSSWRWNPPVELRTVHHELQRYQTKLDRLLYKGKIRKGVRRFGPAMHEAAKDGGIIHAHTLFSDGGLAYEFSKQMGLPYSLSVRNTDLNVFWKYMLHLRGFGRKILENASAIIFLSEAYRQNMRALVSKKKWAQIENKCHVVPNGIEQHWFQRELSGAAEPGLRLLFLGRFDKNKNLHGTIQAAKQLTAQGEPVTLRLVGARGAYADSIRSQYPYDWIEYVNFTKDKAELKQHFAWANVFVMPSFTETFGLVYPEALSQGVPVIYSKGQGFDGWCPDPTCGLGVNPKDTNEIASAISKLAKANNPDACRQLAENFQWEIIAQNYKKIYSDILCNQVPKK